MRKAQSELTGKRLPGRETRIHRTPAQMWTDQFAIDQFILDRENVYPDIRPWFDFF